MKKNLIGDNIKKYRKINNLSQRDLITKLHLIGFDLDQASLARIETHKRGVYDYELLYFANIFKIELEDLYEDTSILDYK